MKRTRWRVIVTATLVASALAIPASARFHDPAGRLANQPTRTVGVNGSPAVTASGSETVITGDGAGDVARLLQEGQSSSTPSSSAPSSAPASTSPTVSTTPSPTVSTNLPSISTTVPPAESPSPTSLPASSPSHRSISVQTKESDGLRVRNGSLRSVMVPSPATAPAERNASAMRTASLQSTLAARGARVRPQFFGRAEAALDNEHDALERRSLESLINKNSFVVVDVPDDVDFDSLLSTLRSLDGVASAEPIPDAPPLPVTPDFAANQGYRAAAVTGIGSSVLANDVVGVTGANVKIIDIEYSWNQSHEDLDKATTALIPQGIPVDPFLSADHGTAVLGILIGDADTQGVTGLVPDAAIGMVNAYGKASAAANPTYNLPNAIDIATASLFPGDVMLIEQQIAGPNGCNASQVGCVAVEWDVASYTAIRAAVLSGIIVVEAAGNGQQNLDVTAAYGSPFPNGRADSGAIIVGAGAAPGCTSPPRSRLSFSTYGSRVNLQGWGQCVTTAGYGGLFNGGANALYTASFGGTSSASPIVAAAAAALSSVAQEQGITLTPRQVRQALVDTATPGAVGANIGGQPNVAAAISSLFVPTPVLSAPANAFTRSIVELDASGSTDPQNDALSFAWDFNNDGIFDDAIGPNPSFPTGAVETTRTVRVRVSDAHGASKSAAVNIVVAAPVRPPAPAATGTASDGSRGTAPSAPGSGSSGSRGAAPQA